MGYEFPPAPCSIRFLSVQAAEQGFLCVMELRNVCQVDVLDRAWVTIEFIRRKIANEQIV